MEKPNVLHILSVCNVSYPARQSACAVLYCNTWAVCFYHIFPYYLKKKTYLLTPWCRVLLEKLTGLQLVKKFAAFHGTRRFITTLTRARHLSLSWASLNQSIYPHPTSCRSILMLSTHLGLGFPSGLRPSGFPSKTLYTPSLYPYAPHAQPISFFSILSPAQYWVRSTNQKHKELRLESIFSQNMGFDHLIPRRTQRISQIYSGFHVKYPSFLL